jgi:hypothetical protein
MLVLDKKFCLASRIFLKFRVVVFFGYNVLIISNKAGFMFFAEKQKIYQMFENGLFYAFYG